MVVHSCIWGTSFCACVHTWVSGVFLRYSPLPCLETESLTQLEAWYFFLTYWLVSFCNPFCLCPAVLESYLCTIMPGFIIIFMWVWGFELCSFLYSPSQNTLSAIRNKCFSQKICKEHYFLFEKFFCWKKKFTSLFLEPEMILSLLLWQKLNYWRC